MKKRDNKQCLLDTPRTVMVSKENYYLEYKSHTKWLSLISSHFAQNNYLAWHFLKHMLNIVCAKYEKASVKALLQVDFPVYAPPKHNPNPHLNAQSCHFVKNYFLAPNFFMQKQAWI